MKRYWKFGRLLSVSMILLASTGMAQIFRADFNGSGNGTGGASDAVTMGGTAKVNPQNNPSVSGAVTNEKALGGESYFDAKVSGGKDAVSLVLFTPISAATSWAALAGKANGGKNVALNGGFDLFVRPNQTPDTEQVWFRPVDIDARPENGLRIVFTGTANNSLQVEVISASESLSLDGKAYNKKLLFSGKVFKLTQGVVSHVGFTFATDDATGKVTLKVFGVNSADAINTATDTNLLSSLSFYINAANHGEKLLTSGAWDVSMRSMTNPFSAQVSYDSMRIWAGNVVAFPALGAK